NVHSGVYLNSAFGVHPTISSNIPVPIFPLTTLGLTVAWNVSELFTWEAAIFDGSAGGFDSNPYNLNWGLSADDGALAITEIQFASSAGSIYKLGVYDHTHSAFMTQESDPAEEIYSDCYGGYLTADQMISGRMDAPGGIALFARSGISPRHASTNSTFIGAGINFYGFLSENSADVLGAGFVCAVMNDDQDETAFELLYRRNLTEQIYFQPDIQYIINPRGTGPALDNCLAATIRFGVQF
ncbi:MAG TPA: carbohydrate porin, partial [Bacteroidota bacterium]|nr:carbohydrate porin [Bacteroidota bacterium]